MNRWIGGTLLGVFVSVVFMSRTADAQGGDIQFSDSARELLEQAGGEAQRLRHEYVGTEHLVLALTSLTHGIALTALGEQRVDLARVRATIEAIVRPGQAGPAGADTLAFTTRTKTVLALAQESAVARGRSEVGAEDLLVGILREGKGVGGQALIHHGVALDTLIESIKRIDSRPSVP